MKHVDKWFLLKSILITIALMTTSCSDASSGCSKEETLKLIGAGYTKDDISGMCSDDSGPYNEILGSWKEIGGSNTVVEFLNDGTLILDQSISTKWSILGDNRLKIEMGMGKVMLTKFRFDDDQLVFVDKEGKITKHNRLTDSDSTTLNSATDATRFSISGDGVISDSQTGLDWRMGPDQDTDYKSAEQWVDTLGSNWRMPTRQELKSIYQKGLGKRNMDPIFKMTGWFVWAELYDSSSAWLFRFSNGNEDSIPRDYSNSFYRVFAVRSK